ncbi:translocator protein homolog [Tripterygium wilfordii]|uniref:translocator protein homolog n=1 Tax=Tripterygium wilfordii TaxID=458696 RepID=UPI0018F84D48|nr:translocator protein homolog [Tripterygium wilfordii]
MESQNLKQRNSRDGPDVTPMDAVAADDKTKSSSSRPRRDKRMATAKRGLRSLAVAVSIPLSMTFFDIYFSGSSEIYGARAKPFWFPPLWILNLSYLGSSFLMGLAAWLVWAEGGFHRNPAALSLYLAQLGLSLAWYPIVFGMGSPWFGLIVCLGMFGALAGCSKAFRAVNPIAGDFVKPCLAWAAFLAVVDVELLFLHKH